MKCAHLVILASLLVIPAPLPVSGDETVTAKNNTVSPEEDDELELAVQMTVQAYRDELEALRSMQDTVSTVNAAERLRKAVCTLYKLYGMSFDYALYREKCTEQLAALEQDCERELQRLNDKDFFGVMPVRALFCDEQTVLASYGNKLRGADPLTQAEIDAIVEQRREALAAYRAQNTWIEGGPGFSRESAWVIKAEDGTIPRERHLLRNLWHRRNCGQSLHQVHDKVYDCLYIIVTRDGEPCRMEQWFDITAYWKAHYNE